MRVRPILGKIKRRLFPPPSYWQSRQGFPYYKRVAEIVREVGKDARSIVDIGSNGCGYLDWFDWIPRRVSLDRRNPYRSPHVEGVKADFFDWQTDEAFDLCLCLQVIEHVPDASRFARKLLRTAPRLIVSVPYNWPAGRVEDHVHDPVEEAKVEEWFGRSADRTILVPEGTSDRMIFYYAS